MFPLFFSFVLFSSTSPSLLSRRLADIFGELHKRGSEWETCPIVQNPRANNARRRNNNKLGLLAWTTFNHKGKGLRKWTNDCLGVGTSILQHHLAGNLTLVVLTLLQYLWDFYWSRQEEAIRKLSEMRLKLIKINVERQRYCASIRLVPRPFTLLVELFAGWELPCVL